MNVPEGSSRGTRVRLPGDVVRPFDVFLNGVRQEEGADYRIDGRRATRRQVARHHRDHAEQQRDGDEGSRIERGDAEQQVL